MKVISLDNFTLWNSDSPGDIDISIPLSGLEYPATRVNSHNLAGTDGTYLSNMFFGERRITINGVLRNSCADDHQEARNELVEACRHDKGSNGQLVPKVLTLTANDDAQYQLDVQVVGVSMPHVNPLWSRFQLDILAHNYLIESVQETTTSVTLNTEGGFTIPFLIPFTLSEGSSGAATVTNTGNATSFPVVKLIGPLTNPRIENSTADRYMSLQFTIPAGQYVEIDMLNRTVLQGGITNRLSTVTSGSNFWGLLPGANTIRLYSALSSEGGSAQVIWRSAWAGI